MLRSLTPHLPIRTSGPPPGRDEDPFRILRLVVGGLLLSATGVALLMALVTRDPRALLLLGSFWALYGIILGFINGILEPVIDLGASLLQNVGLTRMGRGYSAIETLVAGGHAEAAAGEYLARARDGRGDAEAMLRRAVLLAGPLATPQAAAVELENFRETMPLRVSDDVRIGLALADLYEHRLAEPGKAMAELRRLIDRYPASSALRRARHSLAALREARFGGTG